MSYRRKSEIVRLDEIEKAVGCLFCAGKKATTIAIAKKIEMEPSGYFYGLCQKACDNKYIGKIEENRKGGLNVTVYVPCHPCICDCCPGCWAFDECPDGGCFYEE